MKKFRKIVTSTVLALVMSLSAGCDLFGLGGGELGLDEALIYSVERLENADFSFNFTNKKEGGINLTSLNNSVTLANNSNDWIVTGGKDDIYVDEDALGYMEGLTWGVTQTAETAQDMVDEISSRITVLDKLIISNGVYGHLLSYDEESDVVTAYSVFFEGEYIDDSSGGDATTGKNPIVGGQQGGNSQELPDGTIRYAIMAKIYDDADGEEVVEYYSMHYNPVDNLSSNSEYGVYTFTTVKYVPLKEYLWEAVNIYTEPYSLEPLSGVGNLQYFSAKNVDGQFMGINAYGDFEDRFLTIGNTKYGMHATAFFEMGNGFFEFPIYPEYRVVDENGYEDLLFGPITSFDQVSFNVEQGYYSDGVNVTYFPLNLNSTDEITLSLKTLGGWDDCYADVSDNIVDQDGDEVITDYDYYMTLCNYVYLNADEYIKLSNGEKIYCNTIWSKQDGFMRYNEDGSVTMADGSVKSKQEFIDYAKNADYGFITTIGTSGVSLRGTYPECIIYDGFIPFRAFDGLPYGGGANEGDPDYFKPNEELLETFKDFLTTNSLTILDGDPVEVLDYTITASYIKDNILSKLFKGIIGEEYNIIGLGNVYRKSEQNALMLKETLSNAVSSFERLNSNEMPKVSDDFALVSIAGKTSGKINVSNGKIDFSNLKVKVSKSNILRKDQVYGICVYLEGNDGKVIDGVFANQTYDKKDKTYTASGQIDLPTAKDGEYTLKMFFGKPVDNGFVRLSNVVTIEANHFDTIETEAVIDEANYKIVYSCENGGFKMTSKFIDVIKPEVTSNQEMGVDGEFATLTLSDGDIIANLVLAFSVEDNVDGGFYLTEQNFTCDGQAVKMSDKIDFNKTYLLLVEDEAGNKFELKIKPIKA